MKLVERSLWKELVRELDGKYTFYSNYILCIRFAEHHKVHRNFRLVRSFKKDVWKKTQFSQNS